MVQHADIDHTGIPGVGGGGGVGNVLMAPLHAMDPTQTGSGGTANTAYMFPINVPGTMLLRALSIKVQSGAAGSVQWGLFDYSSTPSAAVKLAGGSAAVATNWSDIAASGAPVTIDAGNYMLIVHLPAATAPSLVVAAIGTGAELGKLQAAYSWDDTPDITSGWSALTSHFVMALKGDIDGSTQW